MRPTRSVIESLTEHLDSVELWVSSEPYWILTWEGELHLGHNREAWVLSWHLRVSLEGDPMSADKDLAVCCTLSASVALENKPPPSLGMHTCSATDIASNLYVSPASYLRCCCTSLLNNESCKVPSLHLRTRSFTLPENGGFIISALEGAIWNFWVFLTPQSIFTSHSPLHVTCHRSCLCVVSMYICRYCILQILSVPFLLLLSPVLCITCHFYAKYLFCQVFK